MDNSSFQLIHFKRLLYFFFFASFVSLCALSCDEEEMIVPPQPKPTESTLSDVIGALGGLPTINGLDHLFYIVDGKSYEHEEEEPGHSNPILLRDYNYALYTHLNHRNIRVDYTGISSKYPFEFEAGESSFVIKDKVGVSSGQYDFSSLYFGLVNPVALHAPRIEAMLKNYVMSNPYEIIKRVMAINSDLNTMTTDNKFTLPTLVSDLNIEIEINLETHLPVKATIMESDFLHGDVLFEVSYSGWSTAESLKYPAKITYTYNGNIIKEEQITEVTENPIIKDGLLEPEELQELIFYDPEYALKGVFHTQWYDRLFSLGFPIDIPLNPALVMRDQWVAAGLPDQTIGENVKIIGRPDLSYWAIAIKTPGGVYIVDAPLNQEWCQSIIQAIKGPDGFPGEDIVGVIPTHSHFDHFGGIRELAAEAEVVFMHHEGEEILFSILNANHNIKPDRLAQNEKPVNVTGIDGVLSLEGGILELHAIDMAEEDNNPHSDNMLIVYVPEHELIIQADLFNAGVLVALYAGQGAVPLGNSTIATWNNRAKFLMKYIKEKNLKVSKIIGAHGGVASMAQLEFVAQ